MLTLLLEKYLKNQAKKIEKNGDKQTEAVKDQGKKSVKFLESLRFCEGQLASIKHFISKEDWILRIWWTKTKLRGRAAKDMKIGMALKIWKYTYLW